MAGVGLSWPSKLTHRPNFTTSSPSGSSSGCSSRCAVKMTVTVDEKKTTFTLKKSEKAFNAAKALIPHLCMCELMPGGVNSPVRAFKSVGGQPILIHSVKGSHMWDIDGNEYIDYVGSWEQQLLVMLMTRITQVSITQGGGGKRTRKVLTALAETMKKGTSFVAPCLLENMMAEMFISAVPSIEMVRFVNSGTEACRGVLRLACAFTGREKIIKFEERYLVKAGSGVATLGLPDSPGVPKAATAPTLSSPYNNIADVELLFETNKGEIAAVILEPVVGNSGFITPKPDFLNALCRITKENGALLIFDEVMTGFRLSYGGALEYFGITLDLTTLGKIIGGGLPVGAYGGRREIMVMVAPAGPMYQAEILSGNPLAMTAGIHTLKRLKEPGQYDYLDKITSELVQGFLNAGKKAGHAVCGGYICGMFGFYFTEGPVFNFEDAKKSDTAKFARFFRGMLEEGVYFAPQFEAGFTSLAHTSEDIQWTIAAADKIYRQAYACTIVVKEGLGLVLKVKHRLLAHIKFPEFSCRFAPLLQEKQRAKRKGKTAASGTISSPEAAAETQP
ncbi:hypothetical protein RJ639_035524, partial [Escallonia herrerae]